MTQRLWRRGPEGRIERIVPPPAPEAGSEPARAATAPPPRASLWLGLRLGLRDSYDCLGAVVLISVVSCGLVGLAMIGAQAAALTTSGEWPGMLGPLVGLTAALVGGALVGGPLAAGVFRYARNAAARAEPELVDLLSGLRERPGRALALGLVQALGSGLLITNALFYLTSPQSALAVLGACFLYAFLAWLLVCAYAWPMLIEQDLSPGPAMKKGLLLLLDNPGYSLGLLAALALWTTVLWATVIGGVLLWPGSTAIIVTQAVRELLRKYGLLPPDPTLDPVSEEAEE